MAYYNEISNSDGNCGKIIIATLFCTLLIGIRITTMYSSATTKVVATPITTTNVRESYEIKDGVPVETIITSFGPDPPPGELVPGGSIKQDGKKVEVVTAEPNAISIPDANSSTNNGKKKLR